MIVVKDNLKLGRQCNVFFRKLTDDGLKEKVPLSLSISSAAV